MSQNTELKAQAKKPGLNKKGIAAWIKNYSSSHWRSSSPICLSTTARPPGVA